MLLSLLILGCAEPEYFISGTITERSDGSPIAGADVVLRGVSGGVHAEAVADDSGWFEASMPGSQLFFLHASAEGYTDTSYTGVAAGESVEVVEGELWLRQDEDLEAIRQEFEGCAPETLGDGGVVEGEVRLYVLAGQEVEDLPLVTTATVMAFTDEGVATSGCYLADDGSSDPASEETGETGRFAIFGVPAGLISVRIQYDYNGPTLQEDWYAVYVPEDGVVPLYPALSTMPQ